MHYCWFLSCYFLYICDNFQEFSILCYQWLEYSLHGFGTNAPLLWCWWFLYKLGSSSVRRTRIWTYWSKVCVYGHIFIMKVLPLYFLLCFRWLVSCCIDLSPFAAGLLQTLRRLRFSMVCMLLGMRFWVFYCFQILKLQHTWHCWILDLTKNFPFSVACGMGHSLIVVDRTNVQDKLDEVNM